MSAGDEVFRRVQSAARSIGAKRGTGAPTQEYLIRHTLERGITSTRWRDYVDIVQLARQGIDTDELLRSARAVARYRGVRLEPITSHVAGYGQTGQAKWAAWRRKERLQAVCEADLDAQIALVASYLDPVFARGETSLPHE